jgi:hypothetical protein
MARHRSAALSAEEMLDRRVDHSDLLWNKDFCT